MRREPYDPVSCQPPHHGREILRRDRGPEHRREAHRRADHRHRFVEADTGAGYLFNETGSAWAKSQQLTEAVQAYLEDHPEAIDQAAIEAMFGDQLDAIEAEQGVLKSALGDNPDTGDELGTWVIGGIKASGSNDSTTKRIRLTTYTYHVNKGTPIQAFVTGGGTLIQLQGHSHVDVSFETPWLAIASCCQKFSNPDTSSAGYQAITGYDELGLVSPTRTSDTATADCWSIVIVRPTARKINLVRFGAGNDREYSF